MAQDNQTHFYQAHNLPRLSKIFAGAVITLACAAVSSYGVYKHKAYAATINAMPDQEIATMLLYKQNTIACVGQTLIDNAEKLAPDAGTDAFRNKDNLGQYNSQISACAQSNTRSALIGRDPDNGKEFALTLLGLYASIGGLFYTVAQGRKFRLDNRKNTMGGKIQPNTPWPGHE